MVSQGKLMAPLFSDAMLIRSLLLFLILGSVAGLFTGTAMLLRPGWLQQASKFANRWISTRQMSRPLVQLISLDSWFYRYNRLSGISIMLGSIYILYYFTAAFSHTVALNNLFKSALVPPAMMSGLVDALVLASVMGAVFSMLISLFLFFRPSMLRDFELRANQKTSLRQTIKPLEIQRAGLDRLVMRNMRVFGVLILAGSLYTLIVLLKHWK